MNYAIGHIGIDPDKFWKYTIFENILLKQAYDNAEQMEWQRARRIEFAIYNSQYGAMNGKKIFKNIKSPKDVYPLVSDTIYIKHKVADYTKEKVKELQGVMDDFQKIILNK